MHPSRLVEAAGVEPASGRDQRGTSTCVASSEALSPAVPRRSRQTVGQPVEFRLRDPGQGRQAIPLFDAQPVPRGRRVRWTGCLSSQR